MTTSSKFANTSQSYGRNESRVEQSYRHQNYVHIPQSSYQITGNGFSHFEPCSSSWWGHRLKLKSEETLEWISF